MISRIGKCRACKATSRRDYTESRRERVGVGMYQRDISVFFRTLAGGGTVKPSADFECPRCHSATWDSKRVQGFTTAQPCDARCMGARGFDCQCACGGANHGRNHLVCDAPTAPTLL